MRKENLSTRAISMVILILLNFGMIACGGGGGSGGSHTPAGTLVVAVDSASDGSAIESATVSVYDAKNLIVTNGGTDPSGEFECSLSPGSYSVKVAAQGFKPVPPDNQTAIPFEIMDGRTTTESVVLDVHPNAGNTGQVSGVVSTPAPDSDGVSDVLVIAEDNGQGLLVSGVTGPDGEYALFNVEPGTYTLSVLRSGYRQGTGSVTV